MICATSLNNFLSKRVYLKKEKDFNVIFAKEGITHTKKKPSPKLWVFKNSLRKGRFAEAGEPTRCNGVMRADRVGSARDAREVGA